MHELSDVLDIVVLHIQLGFVHVLDLVEFVEVFSESFLDLLDIRDSVLLLDELLFEFGDQVLIRLVEVGLGELEAELCDDLVEDKLEGTGEVDEVLVDHEGLLLVLQTQSAEASHHLSHQNREDSIDLDQVQEG